MDRWYQPGMFQKIQILILGVLVSQSVYAFDTRFQMDPSVNLQDIEASGAIPVKVTRSDRTFYSDASAVMKVDQQKLLASSLDYDHYVQMGMPNLSESRLVETAPDGATLYIWADMHLD